MPKKLVLGLHDKNYKTAMKEIKDKLKKEIYYVHGLGGSSK
jgi:hypothetical protein